MMVRDRRESARQSDSTCNRSLPGRSRSPHRSKEHADSSAGRGRGRDGAREIRDSSFCDLSSDSEKEVTSSSFFSKRRCSSSLGVGLGGLVFLVGKRDELFCSVGDCVCSKQSRAPVFTRTEDTHDLSLSTPLRMMPISFLSLAKSSPQDFPNSKH